MLPVVLLALGAGALAARRKPARLPPGQGPFDAFPIGVNSEAPIHVEPVQGESGHRYSVSSFAAANGGVYCVAQKKGDVDWISFIISPGGSPRTRYAASADQMGEVEEMTRDFGLVVPAVGGVT